jgi:hypothetical protein
LIRHVVADGEDARRLTLATHGRGSRSRNRNNDVKAGALSARALRSTLS